MNPFERTRGLARAAVAALAVFLSSLVTAYAQPLYQGPDAGSHRLTILGITSESFSGVALNDFGDVLGWAPAPDGSAHIMRWDGKRLFDLGPGQPGGIDNRRWVVGGHKDVTTTHAALWKGHRRLVLLDNQSHDSHASAISPAGHIVGWVNALSPVAMLWHDGTTTSLWPGHAFDVNSSGVAVGWNFIQGQTGGIAVIGNGVHTTILGSASGISVASAINEWGEVVGGDNGRAFLWKDGQAIELAHTGAWAYSSAVDINDSGTIVGFRWPNSGVSSAIWWTDPTQAAVDLNTLLSPEDVAAGWILVQAARVNNRGSILGYASNPSRCPANNCNPYSFLLERSDWRRRHSKE